MQLTIFGLSISSSWGNGHATLLRGLFRALVQRGHRITFFERDTPYYAAHRDLTEIPGVYLCLYEDWNGIRATAEREIQQADVAMVTSYCPDGIEASDLVLGSHAYRVFYDLDTPVTLERLQRGEAISYIARDGLADFDLVLSYAGGPVLTRLREQLGAKRVVPLYGSVDPQVHRPVPRRTPYAGDLSYLGTYSEDRQRALEALFIEPARRRPHHKFVIGGAIYPQLFPWAENIYFVRHVPPAEHASFYCSSRLTLNVTRRAMADMGYCPSGRLFEAAACGVPMISDNWAGLSDFFEPGREILIARSSEDVLAAMDLSEHELSQIAAAARDRALTQHTADRRALELEQTLTAKASRQPGEDRGAWNFAAEQGLGG